MKNSKFLKSGSQAMLAGLALQGFAMVQFLCIVRWLSPDALGTWAMFLTISALVEIARLGMVQNGLIYYSTHQPDEKPRIVASALALSVSISVVGALLLTGVTFILTSPDIFERAVWQMPDLPILMLVYVLITVLNALLRFIDGYNMIEHNFKIAASSAAFFGAVSVALTFIVKQITGNLTVYDLIFIQVISASLNLVFIGKGFLHILKDLKQNVDKQWLKRLFDYGRYGMGSNLSSMLLQRADVLLLGAFVPPFGIAVYNVAIRLVNYLDFPLNSLGSALLPKFSDAHFGENTEGVSRMYEKSVGWLLAITLPMTAVVFFGAKYIIWIVAGEQYMEAAPLLQIIALAGLVKPWGRLLGVLLDAIGKPHLNFRMLFFSMFVTILFNVLLIPFFGAQGAAWASGLATMATILMGQVLLSRWLPVNALDAFKHILPVYKQLSKIPFKKLKTA